MTKISIVVPVFNESPNIQQLIDSITLQSLQPYEVILVDGGSTDDTVEKIRNITLPKLQLKLLIKKGAMPGQGRNVGTEAAAGEWIAYTDAGIKLDSDWLLELNKVREGESEVDIIYGNVIPIVRNFFEKAACISYTPSSKKDRKSTRLNSSHSSVSRMPSSA